MSVISRHWGKGVASYKNDVDAYIQMIIIFIYSHKMHHYSLNMIYVYIYIYKFDNDGVSNIMSKLKSTPEQKNICVPHKTQTYFFFAWLNFSAVIVLMGTDELMPSACILPA